MSQTVEELSISMTEDGQEVIKELDKVLLSKGAWATVMFRYREWNKAKGEFSEDKYSIRRYKKSNGEYRQSSKLNISSKAQALAIAENLQRWIAET